MIKNIFTIIFVLTLIMAWSRYIEWRSIFFPIQDFSYTPDDFGLKYEEVNFKTQDNAQLNAWFVPAGPIKDSRNELTILFSHGNGGNISHRISKIAMLHKLGLNIFIYDYRGYGRSRGGPSEKGLYLDVKAAHAYLTKEKGVKAENIIAFGESLGGAVTVDLAEKEKLKAIILEGVFSSARDMAKEIYPFIPGFFIYSKFDSVSKIKQINIPKLFLHSKNDEIVPFKLSQKLYNAAMPPKIFITIEGGHNTAFIDSQKKFEESISDFLDNLTRDEK